MYKISKLCLFLQISLEFWFSHALSGFHLPFLGLNSSAFTKFWFLWFVAFSVPALDHLCFPKSHWTAINTWRNLRNRLTSICQLQHRKLYSTNIKDGGGEEGQIWFLGLFYLWQDVLQQSIMVRFLINFVLTRPTANEWEDLTRQSRWLVCQKKGSSGYVSQLRQFGPAKLWTRLWPNCGPGQMTARYRVEYSIWHTCQQLETWQTVRRQEQWANCGLAGSG